ncbi:palmitoyltransferase PFA4 [Batrachochytrium salamandrivorans]|nr:palmitoyltransferase PFA4 [Batrachochytrium salamandrivorans]
MGPFYISVAFIYINYYLGCTTDPGSVPRDYDPTLVFDMPASHDSSKEGVSLKARKQNTIIVPTVTGAYCEWTITVSNTDILIAARIYNSSPWLNNCIGHRNLPHFVRFICSVTVASSCCLVLLGVRVWDLMSYQSSLVELYASGGSFKSNSIYFYTPPADDREIIILLINLVILFALLLTVGILSIWQIFYVAYNVTTIESMENYKVEELMRRGKIPSTRIYPYTLSVYQNLQSVFGSRWYLWWVPSSAPGCGLTFPVNETGTLGLWPPREYYLYRKYPYGKPSLKERRDAKSAARAAKLAVVNGTRHVRRGSEGYLVKNLTTQDREAQLYQADLLAKEGDQNLMQDAEDEDAVARLGGTDESSTDFDSFEDDFDEDINLEGIPRVLDDVEEESLVDHDTP